MNEEEIYYRINTVFSQVFKNSNIRVHAETRAADIAGWNSFKHIDIIISIEEALGIELDAREINKLRTVGDLVALISGRFRALR